MLRDEVLAGASASFLCRWRDFVGKPNPLMMRSALNAIDAYSETAAMIGDRIDTDIVSGLEAGMQTILVLTGVTTREDAERYSYRASRVVESIAHLVDEV